MSIRNETIYNKSLNIFIQDQLSIPRLNTYYL